VSAARVARSRAEPTRVVSDQRESQAVRSYVSVRPGSSGSPKQQTHLSGSKHANNLKINELRNFLESLDCR
jgi:hypothetical protein